MPWARPRSRFTYDFESGWRAWHCADPASTVAALARVEWHTLGEVCASAPICRPCAAGVFEGARRIGIDKTSYKKGHKYLIVVIDHDRRCLIWVHEEYGKDVLNLFFDELT